MKRALIFGAMLLTFASGAFAISVKTDYDHSVNLATYRTFAWKESKPANGIVNNDIVLSRIQSAVDERLTHQGMRQDDRNPDVYLVTHVGAKNMTDIDYLPAPGGWRHWGWMRQDMVVDRYVEGRVVIDLVDARTNRLVWRSIATDRGSNLIQVQSEKNIEKMVTDAFKHFPRAA